MATDPRKAARWDALATQYHDKSDQEITAMVEQEFPATEPPPRMGSARVAGRAAAQGLTMGFRDELAGLGAALVPGGQGYQEARDASRALDEEARRANPLLYGATEFASGFLVPGLGSAKLVGAAGKGASALARAGRTIAGGAAMGGLGSLGYTEGSFKDQAKQVGIGTAIGGGLGLLGAAVKPAAEFVNRRVLGGSQKFADAQAAKALQSILDEADLDDVAVRGAESSARASGKNAILADLSDDTRDAFEVSMNLPGMGKSTVAKSLKGRREGVMGRISDDIEEAIGTPPAWAQGTDEQIVQARAALADKLYGRARAFGVVDDPIVNAHLTAIQSDPIGKQVYDATVQLVKRGKVIQAQKDLAAGTITRERFLDEVANLAQEGGYEHNVEFFDLLKRGLQKVEEAGLNATGKPGTKSVVGRQIGDQIDLLLNRLDEVVPDYKVARKAFAGASAEREAIEAAQDAVRSNDARAFRNALGKSQAGGTETVFRGVAQDELLRPGRRAARPYGTSNPDALNAITTGDRADMLMDMAGKNAPDLDAKFQWEQAGNKTYNESLGNSKTAKRLLGAMGQKDIAAGIDYGVGSALTGNVPLAARALAASTLKYGTRLGERRIDRALMELLASGDLVPGSLTMSQALAKKNLSPIILNRLNARNDALAALLSGSLAGYMGTPRNFLPQSY